LDPGDGTSESDEDNVVYSKDDSDSAEGADIAKIFEIRINVLNQGCIQCIYTPYTRKVIGGLGNVRISLLS